MKQHHVVDMPVYFLFCDPYALTLMAAKFIPVYKHLYC